jgi:hypothetical protein
MGIFAYNPEKVSLILSLNKYYIFMSTKDHTAEKGNKRCP